MIRYYFINVDTKRGDDVEYIFHNRTDAENMYNKIDNFAYKALKVYDDKLGDVMLKCEKEDGE